MMRQPEVVCQNLVNCNNGHTRSSKPLTIITYQVNPSVGRPQGSLIHPYFDTLPESLSLKDLSELQARVISMDRIFDKRHKDLEYKLSQLSGMQLAPYTDSDSDRIQLEKGDSHVKESAAITRFLDELGLGEHAETFISEDVWVERICFLKSADLDKLGLRKIGSRAVMLSAIAELRHQHHQRQDPGHPSFEKEVSPEHSTVATLLRDLKDEVQLLARPISKKRKQYEKVIETLQCQMTAMIQGYTKLKSLVDRILVRLGSDFENMS